MPKKIEDRLIGGIKRYQPILSSAKSRDVNESDTVTIIKDILADVFGYDKYSEITSEYAIRGTYCDLAIKIDNELRMLIEAKAIGLELKDAFVKQAIDYAANQGIEWVVLTNGDIWRIYKVTFGKPIGQELVLEFKFTELNPKKANTLELVHLLSKESWAKSLLGEYHTQRQALSRFLISAMVLTEPVLQAIKRELKRLSPGVRIEIEDIKEVLRQEVLKRDVLEGENAEEATKKIRASNKVRKPKLAKERSQTETREEKLLTLGDTSGSGE
jgi:predicted type IV restriction endonuclease